MNYISCAPAPEKRCRFSSLLPGHRGPLLAESKNLLAEIGSSRSSLRIYFGRAQGRTAGLAVTKNWKGMLPGIRGRTIPEDGRLCCDEPGRRTVGAGFTRAPRFANV